MVGADDSTAAPRGARSRDFLKRSLLHDRTVAVTMAPTTDFYLLSATFLARDSQQSPQEHSGVFKYSIFLTRDGFKGVFTTFRDISAASATTDDNKCMKAPSPDGFNGAICLSNS